MGWTYGFHQVKACKNRVSEDRCPPRRDEFTGGMEKGPLDLKSYKKEYPGGLKNKYIKKTVRKEEKDGYSLKPVPGKNTTIGMNGSPAECGANSQLLEAVESCGVPAMAQLLMSRGTQLVGKDLAKICADLKMGGCVKDIKNLNRCLTATEVSAILTCMGWVTKVADGICIDVTKRNVGNVTF